MKNRFAQIILSVFVTIICSYAYAQNNSPIGYWKTVDDKTGQVLSVVQIYPAGNNTLSGRIVKIMPVLGQKPTDLCTQCKGGLHNRRILGMTVVWGMTQVSQDTWARGHALDPKSGETYQGTMTVKNNGNNLALRGYIGISLFGRTQTWIRTSKP